MHVQDSDLRYQEDGRAHRPRRRLAVAVVRHRHARLRRSPFRPHPVLVRPEPSLSPPTNSGPFDGSSTAGWRPRPDRRRGGVDGHLQRLRPPLGVLIEGVLLVPAAASSMIREWRVEGAMVIFI